MMKQQKYGSRSFESKDLEQFLSHNYIYHYLLLLRESTQDDYPKSIGEKSDVARRGARGFPRYSAMRRVFHHMY